MREENGFSFQPPCQQGIAVIAASTKRQWHKVSVRYKCDPGCAGESRRCHKAPSGAENQPLAIKVPIGKTGLVEVLQKPTPAVSDRSIFLVVDAIDYTESGELIVAGKAPVAADILIYLNNNFIGRTTADEKSALEPETI